MRYAAPICCLLLLCGCTSPLKQLEAINPLANDFKTSLASEYKAYGESESEQGRMASGEYYAAKGMRALNGVSVLPDKPAAHLSTKEQGRLSAARQRLTGFLTEDMKRVAPQKLAHAQVMFDCWQHQLSDNVNGAPCADEFNSTMSELADIEDNLNFGRETAYNVTFRHGNTEVDDTGKATIKGIAEKLSGQHHYRVTLETYIGIHDRQHQLSKTRIEVVRKLLIAAGISARSIHVKTYGSPRVVILSRDKIPANTKIMTITVKTDHAAARE